ncbi:hypothetical protein EZV61_11180 [Corallincola luteus]|uniref:Uncharacterized protein n=1 Tax=Corallincola luteus TaxID=1775177 RepID=A0ABY2AJA3_9GAMM|nr:hypothetical protein EZV61_11180 [Corallincola luteus]
MHWQIITILLAYFLALAVLPSTFTNILFDILALGAASLCIWYVRIFAKSGTVTPHIIESTKGRIGFGAIFLLLGCLMAGLTFPLIVLQPTELVCRYNPCDTGTHSWAMGILSAAVSPVMLLTSYDLFRAIWKPINKSNNPKRTNSNG